MMEVGIVLNDLVTMLDHLDDLTSPQHHPRDMLNKFNSLYLQAEPYGVVLIIAPWNYPFQLVMLPLMGAIAAGTTSHGGHSNRYCLSCGHSNGGHSNRY